MSINTFAPLIIFAYNRPEHLSRLIESLKVTADIENTDVFFYLDGPRNKEDNQKVSAVEQIAEDFKDSRICKTVLIVKSVTNKGLAVSVIDGVSDIISKYGKCIVLEDDLVVSSDFLGYMNRALNFYEISDTWAVSGYSFPMKALNTVAEDIYFSARPCSWGWGTWADRWKQVDWKVSDYDSFSTNIIKRLDFSRWGADLPDMLDRCMEGKIQSWAIRWTYAAWKSGKLTVYPKHSKVINIGADGSGTNFNSVVHRFDTPINVASSDETFVRPVVYETVRKQFKKRFTPVPYYIKLKLREALRVSTLILRHITKA